MEDIRPENYIDITAMTHPIDSGGSPTDATPLAPVSRRSPISDISSIDQQTADWRTSPSVVTR